MPRRSVKARQITPARCAAFRATGRSGEVFVTLDLAGRRFRSTDPACLRTKMEGAPGAALGLPRQNATVSPVLHRRFSARIGYARAVARRRSASPDDKPRAPSTTPSRSPWPMECGKPTAARACATRRRPRRNPAARAAFPRPSGLRRRAALVQHEAKPQSCPGTCLRQAKPRPPRPRWRSKESGRHSVAKTSTEKWPDSAAQWLRVGLSRG